MVPPMKSSEPDWPSLKENTPWETAPSWTAVLKKGFYMRGVSYLSGLDILAMTPTYVAELRDSREAEAKKAVRGVLLELRRLLRHGSKVLASDLDAADSDCLKSCHCHFFVR